MSRPTFVPSLPRFQPLRSAPGLGFPGGFLRGCPDGAGGQHLHHGHDGGLQRQGGLGFWGPGVSAGEKPAGKTRRKSWGHQRISMVYVVICGDLSSQNAGLPWLNQHKKAVLNRLLGLAPLGKSRKTDSLGDGLTPKNWDLTGLMSKSL